MQCVFVVCLLFTFQAPGSRESLPFVFCISDVDGKLPLCIDTAVVLFCFGCAAKLLRRIILCAVDGGVGCQFLWC